MSEYLLKDYLEYNKIIADGAFGTYFDALSGGESPELSNQTNPELVKKVHLEYIKSGARLLRSNTFAANTKSLNMDLEKVLELISMAVGHANEAKKEYIEQHQMNKMRTEIFIAGDMGPIPFTRAEERDAIVSEYISICRRFISLGVDALLFETFSGMDIIEDVIHTIKQESQIPIWVQMSVNQIGYSDIGISAKSLYEEMMTNPDIDFCGFNCGVGPGHMYRILKDLPPERAKPFSVLPNASYPKIIRGQVVFSQNEVYFAKKMMDILDLKVSVIGGCCGTKPSFIKALADQVSELQDTWQAPEFVAINQPESQAGKIIESSENTAWIYHPKREDKKLIAVELSPPLLAADEKLMQAAAELSDSKIDVVTFPDSPSGRTRADSILMAAKVRSATGLRVMPHICCRDKNAIAIRSQLLGAYISDVKDFLIITGDPIPTMARGKVKGVFNFDSVGLMKIVKEVNKDMDKGPICYGGAINQNRLNLQVEIDRVKKKMEAGALYFFTQPIFTPDEIEKIRQIKAETGAVILGGVMPLISQKNALFIQNEMTGMHVTDEIVARFDNVLTKEEGEKVGIMLAREVMESMKDVVDGYYFSLPFNRVYLLKDIL